LICLLPGGVVPVVLLGSVSAGRFGWPSMPVAGGSPAGEQPVAGTRRRRQAS